MKNEFVILIQLIIDNEKCVYMKIGRKADTGKDVVISHKAKAEEYPNEM